LRHSVRYWHSFMATTPSESGVQACILY